MGAEPKRKLHRKGQRRSHLRALFSGLSKCLKTGRWKRPHFVSPYTGEYKGKKLVAAKAA